eukprot:SAG11_NODE_419_length_9648_cov_6.815478_2_plen_88_part_00
MFSWVPVSIIMSHSESIALRSASEVNFSFIISFSARSCRRRRNRQAGRRGLVAGLPLAPRPGVGARPRRAYGQRDAPLHRACQYASP